MTADRTSRELLPEAVTKVMEEFRSGFGLDFHLWLPRPGETPHHLYPPDEAPPAPDPASLLLEVPTRRGDDLILELRGHDRTNGKAPSNALRAALEELYSYSEEIHFFTYEVSERFEEINLLYSISETLGSVLHLKDAARIILSDVCEVLGAARGSLWVHDPDSDRLDLVASVGEEGLDGPIRTDDPTAVTSEVFRDARPLILTGDDFGPRAGEEERLVARTDSVLSVPIRYTPPDGEARTVGVLNLIGRVRGGRFTASDQKLLAAIASQVGAALENNRLIRSSLERERVTREMELAHNLQMKLLPAMEGHDPGMVAARVEPAESVGGDFYHFFRLPGERFGVMIGDVSSHGFPAALIMALSMSAATIYATEVQTPARVLNEMDRALRDELLSTEMYLTLFYAVVDPERGELVYANAGHPHAFVISTGGDATRLEAMDPPMGIAPEGEYHQRAVGWKAGDDLLLLFTDGLSDPLDATSRIAGEERVVAEAVRLRDEPAGAVVAALFELHSQVEGALGEGDDRTAIVLRG